MPDYTSNSKKIRDAEQASTEPKNIERVIVSDVIVKKKSIGRKFRDLFIEADLRTVIRYVGSDVLLPALRNMIVDGSQRGVERLVYGDTAMRRRNIGQGPRITYNSPVNRSGFGGSPLNYAPPQRPGAGTSRLARTEIILSTREEGDLVLEQMMDIISQYEVVSIADLNALIGQASNHVDQKWGWSNLNGTQIRQIREGFLIDLPAAEPIS